MFTVKNFVFSESENGEVWYYSSAQQFEELLDLLDSNEMEAPLVRELLELKQEILRQMEITEKLTNQAKGNRKSYLEIENANICKQRKLKKELKLSKCEGNLDDDKVLPDADVVNEVTVTSEESARDDQGVDHDIKDDDKRSKNNGANKLKFLKRCEEGSNIKIYLCTFNL